MTFIQQKVAFAQENKAVPELSAAKTPDGKVRAEVKDYFPKPKYGNTYVIAHRGAHIGIPENSLAAIQKAIDLGCDFVEIDTRATKDGRIVSVHNETIDQYVTCLVYSGIAHGYNAKVFVDEKKGTPDEWEQIINWGTDGIQTDNPAALIEFLKKRK